MTNKQLRLGLKVEAEHAHTMRFISKYLKTHNKLPAKKLVYMSIAKDHLKEDKKYYTKLSRAKL
jgi:sulfur relay (sulfurtransferase) DsrC/TusE family protein